MHRDRASSAPSLHSDRKASTLLPPYATSEPSACADTDRAAGAWSARSDDQRRVKLSISDRARRRKSARHHQDARRSARPLLHRATTRWSLSRCRGQGGSSCQSTQALLEVSCPQHLCQSGFARLRISGMCVRLGSKPQPHCFQCWLFWQKARLVAAGPAPSEEVDQTQFRIRGRVVNK